MNKTNPNDEAFPVASTSRTDGWGGLTKREYFAATIAQGYFAHTGLGSISERVALSVLAADLLIKELNKSSEDGLKDITEARTQS